MAAAGDIAKAAVPMGMLLAWCAAMHLLSREFQDAHERKVLQVRMQEVGGSELLVAGGGELQRAMFSEAGQQFLDRYYPRYLSDLAELFDGDIYEVEDNPANYSKVAKMVTAHYMGRGEGVLKKISRWFRT